MLPNTRTLFIVSVVAFASNWQFGYQITYVNTASEVFGEFANKYYVNEASIPAHSSVSLWCFVMAMVMGRILVGIQAGCSLCLLPLFIIEAAPIENRPFLSSLQEVFQALSTLLGLMIGTIPFHIDDLECFQIIALVPMYAFIAFIIFLPDTPLFLLEVRSFGDNSREFNRPDDAFNNHNIHFEREFYKSVTFYHGHSTNVSSIREEAFERWSIEMSDGDKGLRAKENIKGIIIGSLAGISLAFTADDLIDSYSSQLFYRVENPDARMGEGGFGLPIYMQIITILLGLWLLITSIFGAYLIDRFGRKRLIIAGLIGSSLSNLFSVYGASVSSIVLMTIGFVFTKSFIGFGAGGPAWFLTSELVSPKITCTAQSISTGLLLLMTGVVTFLFLPLEVSIGAWSSLLLLSSVPSFIIAMLLIVFLPETKDRSYEQIRHCLGSKFFSGFCDSNEFEDNDWMQFVGNNFNPLSRREVVDPQASNGAVKQPASPRANGSLKYPRLMSASSYASYGSLYNAARFSRSNLGQENCGSYYRQSSYQNELA